MQYQTNRMSQSRDITQKLDFGSNLSLNLDRKFFFHPQDHQYLQDIVPVYYMQNQKNLIVQTGEHPQDHSKMELGEKIIQLNISISRFFPDMRFSQGVHRHFALSFSVKSWGQ
jgi:hypothetical protein